MSIKVKTRSISPEAAYDGSQAGPVFDDPRWLEYRRKWDEYPQRGIVGPAPLQIDLFAVDVCNLKCPMCPRNDHVPGTGFMDFALVKKVIDEGAAAGLCALNFAGLGEPTLYPKLFEVIAYAKAKGIRDVNMHTNATRLDPAFNRRLLDSGLDRLIVSLDSADKQRYERIRVGASFDKVCAGVKDLVSQRMARGSLVPQVKANFIEMDENDPTDKQRFISFWKGTVDRIAVLRYLDCAQGTERLHFKDHYKQDADFCCPELWRRMTILSDGTVTLCPRDMQRHVVFGSVKERTVTGIWAGEAMTRIRDMHRSGSFKKVSFCGDCPDSYDSMRGTP